MPANPVEQRRERLTRLLDPVCSLEEFTSREIQLACHELAPAFITRVLSRLTAEGILATSKTKGQTSYRWQTARENFAPHAWVERYLNKNQISQVPEEDRPRERLLKLGPAQLRTAELLAILIRVGRPGESALQAGERLANHYHPDLSNLRRASEQELKSVSPVASQAVYCQIMAGIELGRRVAELLDREPQRPQKIDSTGAAIAYCQQRFRRLAVDRLQEEFHIVTLDTKLFPIASHQITVGTLDASLVHPREVFRAAIRDAASAIILVHNHPSGDPTPSREDLQVTERLRKSAEILGIRVLDHIVVASDSCVSICDWESQRR